MSRPGSALSSLVLAVLLLAPAAGDACGPDFPFEFLSQRDLTLARLPDSLFLLEAGRLISPPQKRMPVVEEEEPAGVRDGGGEQERALYRAGALLWEKDEREKSRPKFLQLLALPEAERRTFTLLAEFTLARISDTAEARARYAKVRALVEAGWADPLGLGVSSLGQEARLALWAGDDVKAVALYAQQASHGSQSGAVSLLFLARSLVRAPARLDRALGDPLVQRLLATYLWTRSTESWWDERAQGPGPQVVLTKLLARPRVAGADHLAAALFRAGRFEDAQRLVEKEDSPIAHWVKAKLLLRHGQREAADQELELASRGYPLTEQWGVPYLAEYRPRQQMDVERAILALSHDDFDGAMRHAQESCSWEDVAYLGERVLDVDTLRRLVDAPGFAADPCRAIRTPSEEVDSSQGWMPRDQREALRQLLARRLLRAGRGREALAYFDDATRPDAEAYVRALDEGQHAADPLVRARGLAEAAHLARHRGMELLGFEGAPDFGWTRGYYEPTREPTDGGVTPEEWRRWTASGPKVPERYHYRAEASRLAEEAANLLSPRSPAFNAMLCRSAAYIRFRDEPRFRALWHRAVKEGRLHAQDMAFGYQCPTPAFVAPPELKRARRPLRKRYVAALVALGAAVLGAGAAWVVRRRG